MKFPWFKSGAKRSSASTAENTPYGGDPPGMVSSDEIAFFRECAARYVGKEGAIVDLGCWLGATSIALAQGIASRASAADTQKEKVLAFDTFVWDDWMPAHIPFGLYQPGESFLPEARRIVRDRGGGRVELIQADLAHYEWKRGPIKLLLVDAMKNEDMASRIPSAFYPSLLMGALLIHQDFKHYYTSWIHVIQYRLRQYFRVVGSVARSGTAAFEVIAPIPADAVDRATKLATMIDQEIDEAFRHSLDLVGPEDCANVAAAHVMQYVHLGRKDRALATLETYRSLPPAENSEIPRVIEQIEQMRSR